MSNNEQRDDTPYYSPPTFSSHPTPSSSSPKIINPLPSDALSITIEPPSHHTLSQERQSSRHQFRQDPSYSEQRQPRPHQRLSAGRSVVAPVLPICTVPYHHGPTSFPSGLYSIKDQQSPDSADTTMTRLSTRTDHLLLDRNKDYPSTNNGSSDTLEKPFDEKDVPPPHVAAPEVAKWPQRHPPRLEGSLYTRFFGFNHNNPATSSSVIVHSSWLPTGVLFGVRFVLFLYTFVVLLTDLIVTERPQFSWCYLTQLSYLGLTSYLGTVSWHTRSEWLRERAFRKRALDSSDPSQIEAAATTPTASASTMASAEGQVQPWEVSTTIERQHWFLTDMVFFLYHTICTFHVIVPLLYWGYLSYAGEAHTMAVRLNAESLWRNYSFHGGDLIVVAIEILINTMPFIPTHLTIVFGTCLLYLAEAHVVHYVDGFWIYPFLDTSGGPLWMALYIGVGFVILCAFTFMYYLHRIRNWVRGSSDLGPGLGDSSRDNNNNHSFSGLQPMMTGMNMSQSTIVLSMPGNHDSNKIILLPSIPPPAFIPPPPPPPHTTANRRRSCSSSSNESTTSTLVGGTSTTTDLSKPMPALNPPLKSDVDYYHQPNGSFHSFRLEKVEEVNEDETEEEDQHQHQHPSPKKDSFKR